MTEAAVAFTDLPSAKAAGQTLGAGISKTLQGQRPDVLILFASPRYDYTDLLSTIDDACRPGLMIGCSSAGEFTDRAASEGAACALALRAPEMRFTAGIGHGLRADRRAAAEELIASFEGLNTHDYLYRTALVLTDALAGYADDLIEQLTLLTGGTYQFAGGGAGDDANFDKTYVFYGTEAYADAVVALEILSNKPIGIGVSHGWKPAGSKLRVTESEGMCLVSLNAIQAADVFEEHARVSGQPFDPAAPLPFFLHNVLGIESEVGHKLRVPLGIREDRSVPCATDVPTGVTVRIMQTEPNMTAQAAERATQAAIEQLDGHTPEVALFFDCVATRLRMGREFGVELETLQRALGSAKYVGFNTYGQVARAEGQFSGFHNCTAVTCIIPE